MKINDKQPSQVLKLGNTCTFFEAVTDLLTINISKKFKHPTLSKISRLIQLYYRSNNGTKLCLEE